MLESGNNSQVTEMLLLPRPRTRRFIAFIASSAYNRILYLGNAVSTLTIRNLDERLKGLLRIRAATRGRSMEEEVRQILRVALDDPRPVAGNLADRVRRRFASLGDVQLPIPGREAVRFINLPADVPQQPLTEMKSASGPKVRRRA